MRVFKINNDRKNYWDFNYDTMLSVCWLVFIVYIII